MAHCPDEQVPVPLLTTHATPQAPQLFTLLVRFVSQPSATWPLQSPAPGAQLAMPHTPPLQLGVPPVVEHWLPQAPQLFTFVAVLTSQPLAALLSQLANPCEHWMEHCPAEQLGDPLTVLQACPQAPQCSAFVPRSTSQPLDAVPSQSAYPELHDWIAHAPFEQVGVAFGRLQALAQAPQLDTLVLRFTSQPSVAFPLQSALGSTQPEVLQTPASHVGVAFGNEQTLPQAPQLSTSFWRSTSQPFAEAESQSALPLLHVPTWQTPAWQISLAFNKSQISPQLPQLATLLSRLTSQPLVGSLSQFSNPALQAPSAHAPLAQAGSALGRPAHSVPHAPQFTGSVAVSDSQPSAGLALQSRYPG